MRTGEVISLSIPLDSAGPQLGPASPSGRGNPVHLMSQTGAGQDFASGFRFADDYVFMALQSGTQWDALAHVFYDGALYNGFDAAKTITPFGASRNAVTAISPGVTGRGVLLDLPALHGVSWLEAGQPITPDDLDACARRQRVDVRSGDIIAVRTGWRRKFLQCGASEFMDGEPGLNLSCAQWLVEHEVAAVCSDNWAIEVQPPAGFEASAHDDPPMALHMVLLRDVGMPLGELFDLEALAEVCSQGGRYEFLFVGVPLLVTGAVGAPVHPVAIF